MGRKGEKGIRLRRREGAQASGKSIRPGEGSNDTPMSEAAKRRDRIRLQKGQHRRHSMITHAAAQNVMPNGSGISAQHGQKRIATGKPKEAPQMREGEEGEVNQSNWEAGPLG